GLAWRLLSASEVLLGAAIVIGHNVFRVVPNEVPILFVLGVVSVRIRDGGWSAIGFRRPESWLRLILIVGDRARNFARKEMFTQKIFLSSPAARKGRSIAPCACIIFWSVSR